MTQADGRAVTNPFKRRQFEAPHRKRRAGWRVVKPLLGALFLVGVPAGAAYWALTHPSFHLQNVSVVGSARVPAEWVQERLQPLHGRPLLLIELSEVESLLRHQWVGGLAVRKELPRGLAVEVIERQPVAVLTRGAESVWVDAAGRSIAAADPRAVPEEMLRIQAAPGAAPDVAAVLAAIEVARREGGDWMQGLERVDVSVAGDVSLHARDLPFPLLLRPEGAASGLARLPGLLNEILHRYPQAGAVDLRFEQRIVIQNAAPESSREG